MYLLKRLGLVVATALLFMILTQAVFAAEPTVTVSTVAERALEQVDVKINISDNPGIISMLLKVEYDERLTLIKVTNGTVLKGPSHNTTNLELNPYTLSWADDLATENNTANGTIVTLTFEISEDAVVGELLPVTVYYDNENAAIYDMDFNLIDFAVINGGVEVIEYEVGDLNGDGAVNSFDRTILSRHLANWTGYTTNDFIYQAADVNKDGTINAFDRTILARYIAKCSGYDALPYLS